MFYLRKPDIFLGDALRQKFFGTILAVAPVRDFCPAWDSQVNTIIYAGHQVSTAQMIGVELLQNPTDQPRDVLVSEVGYDSGVLCPTIDQFQ